jgi:hypothetical protein
MQNLLNMKLRVRNGDEERIVTVTDFPGDASLITLEPSLNPDDPGAIICGFEEVDDGDDDRPIQVGWHVSSSDNVPWEIVEIIEE